MSQSAVTAPSSILERAPIAPRPEVAPPAPTAPPVAVVEPDEERLPGVVEPSAAAPSPIGGPLPAMPPSLRAGDLRQAEYTRNVWIANPPPGTPMDAVLQETFWAHVADQGPRPWDEIDVRYQDAKGSLYMKLLITAAGRGFLRVVELYRKEFDNRATAASGDYGIDFHPASQHRVIRLSDNTVLRDNLVTRDAALMWLSNHMQSGRPANSR